MSAVQIPNLPVAIALSGAEQLEAVQAGSSVRVTSAQIATLAWPPSNTAFTAFMSAWFATLPRSVPSTPGLPWNHAGALSFSQ